MLLNESCVYLESTIDLTDTYDDYPFIRMFSLSFYRICCGSLEGHDSTVWSISFEATGNRLGAVSTILSKVTSGQGIVAF